MQVLPGKGLATGIAHVFIRRGLHCGGQRSQGEDVSLQAACMVSIISIRQRQVKGKFIRIAFGKPIAVLRVNGISGVPGTPKLNIRFA